MKCLKVFLFKISAVYHPYTFIILNYIAIPGSHFPEESY